MALIMGSRAEATPSPVAFASPPPDASSQPTKVALVGAHGHGASHLRRIADLVDKGVVDLSAVADPRPPDASAAAPPDAPWYSSLEELLASEVTTPDIVVLSTPLPTHLALAERALRAGCDVLLEKPPTANASRPSRMSSATSAITTLTRSGTASSSASRAPLFFLWYSLVTVVPCLLGSSLVDAQHLPHGRRQVGDRHLKFHESRDNLEPDPDSRRARVG